ncbi:MAG: carboxyltransferase domain-containing protein [Trueperaceae bacterium]|nr:carboxyltransferase domain-containing protein [Trueperaceae bacterium]MCO5173314.1 urea amidolyase family protein [Trueperaceae bacterium]
MRVETAGPWARYLVLGGPPSPELSRRIGAVAEALRAALPRGAFDVVPGYLDILVEGRAVLAPERLLALAEAIEVTGGASDGGAYQPRTFEVPVAYGAGADAATLTERLGLAWPDIAGLHAAGKYTVAYVGFTPGFPYLHGLDPRLQTPRRDRPRPDVPAGAVAMAGAQAGIYPEAGPGGWWVLGTTSFPLFMPDRPEPTVLRAGDELRFVPQASGGGGQARGRAPIDADVGYHAPPGTPTFGSLGAPAEHAAAEPLVSVLEVWPESASLQGRPRVGVGRHGLAEAGALDQRLLLALHLAVGAPLDGASIELPVPHAALRAEASTVAAFGGAATASLRGEELTPGVPFEWRAGDVLALRPAPAGPRRRAGVPILSFAGGLAPLDGHAGHPLLAAGGSTDVRGHVGGFGRWLRAGDVMARGAGRAWSPGAGTARRTADAGTTTPTWPPVRPVRKAAGGALGHYPSELHLRLYPGARTGGFAHLLSRTFVVSERSRMGVRLEPRGERDTRGVPVTGAETSRGMPLGAVQLPPDGRPLVLLADRGRTGGYPVVGVVARVDLAGLAQARPGTVVTFHAPGEHGS